MSSHREAPEISKDPVADSADLYAFVSPDNPSTVTIIANYVPSPAAGRRAELLRVRRRRAVRGAHRQRRRRHRRHHLPVPVQHRAHQHRRPRPVPLQHGPDHASERHDLEPQAVLLGHPRRQEGDAPSRQGPGLPTVQRRARTRSPTTLRSPPRRSTRSARAATFSPANVPTASTSTSGRSSTSATSGLSSPTSFSRARRWPASTPSPG